MTEEQRAAGVVQDYHAKRCWGYDPVQHADYETLLAAAIREAVAAERERICHLLLGGHFLHDDAPAARLAREAVAAIRKGGQP